jgi:hypothetical protein
VDEVDGLADVVLVGLGGQNFRVVSDVGVFHPGRPAVHDVQLVQRGLDIAHELARAIHGHVGRSSQRGESDNKGRDQGSMHPYQHMPARQPPKMTLDLGKFSI